MKKILYIGDLWDGSTALHRRNALEDLGNIVVNIDSSLRYKSFLISIVYRFFFRLGYKLDINKVNRQIRHLLNLDKFDILWVDKGLCISTKTLHFVKTMNPSITLVYYSPDDMNNWFNQPNSFKTNIKLYNLIVTTKSFNIPELKELGVQDILFIDNAYDPEIHRILPISEEENYLFNAEVSFIGSYEQERADYILSVAKAGFTIKVFGKSWRKMMNKHTNLIIIPKDIYGEEYPKVFNASKINLCFLRKINRDLQTTRSIEIPASGGFMLAERTIEHLRLFNENQEAAFFESKEELIQKIHYFLQNNDERTKIAFAGYQKCKTGKYSNQGRLESVITHLSKKEKK